VEVGLVKLMEMRRLASLGDLVGRIAELESALRTGRPPAERKNPQTTPSTAAGGSRSASASGSGTLRAAADDEVAARSEPDIRYEAPAAITMSQPGSVLDQIKTELDKKKKKLLVAAIDAAAKVELEAGELVIEFSAGARDSRDRLARPDNVKILREVCVEVCGGDVGIRFSIRDGESDEAPISPEEDSRHSKQQARQAAAQNPTVQQALRTFGGEIVDVKMP
jgi:hypothetical protein